MTQIDFDLTVPDDCNLYEKIDDIFTFYEDVSTRCSVRLSQEFMTRLESEEPTLLLDEETDIDE